MSVATLHSKLLILLSKPVALAVTVAGHLSHDAFPIMIPTMDVNI